MHYSWSRMTRFQARPTTGFVEFERNHAFAAIRLGNSAPSPGICDKMTAATVREKSSLLFPTTLENQRFAVNSRGGTLY